MVMLGRSVCIDVLRKAVCILLFICLVSRSSAKPALEAWYEKFESDELPPPYIQCRTTSDCHDMRKCCSIGRQRFSIPQCSPYGEEGALCFPGAVAVHKNLSYPDGVTVHYKGVYDIVCPCAMGHNCDPSTHQCVKDSHFIEGKNSIDTYFRPDNDYNYQYN